MALALTLTTYTERRNTMGAIHWPCPLSPIPVGELCLCLA